MRAYVFTDAKLAGQAGRFVWLEIDTEKRENAAFRRQFPPPALPTYFIVDPATEKVALRWVGGATLPQLEKLLDDGRRAVKNTGAVVAKETPAGKSTKNADAALVHADRAYGAGNDAEAVKAYREALERAPDKWPSYARTVESLLFALQRTKDYEGGVLVARDAFPRLARSASAGNVAGSGLDCALSLPEDHPHRAEFVRSLEAMALAVVADATIPCAADDRSGVYGVLLSARQDAKDEAGARATAERWAAFLDAEAAAAPNADARSVFDSHRLSAYLAAKTPERAVPMLEASERDLPQDYNPPARLAVAYRAMQRWDDALAAADRALAKAYGPRRLGILQTRADILKGRGDLAAARTTLEDALREAEALPEGQRSESSIANLRKKIEALPSP